jgi:hypothetical protein
MNSLDVFRSWMIPAFAVLLLLSSIGIAEGQNPAHLTVTVTGQSLTAGFNNNVTVTVTNSYYPKSFPSAFIYDVDVAISLPSPLNLFGDSHWHYDQIASGASVAISFQVYAFPAGIGNSYQGSVTVTYKQLPYTSYTVETHEVSFSVHGWISLVLYSVQVAPSVSEPGGNATISGNVLNSGNVNAFNATVTVESEALAQGTMASVFVGEVDTNILRPFSLTVNFKKNLAEGNYSLVVKVSAIDSNTPSSPYNAQHTSQVQIKKTVVRPTTQTRQAGGMLGIILEILRYLYGVFFGSPTTAALVLSS